MRSDTVRDFFDRLLGRGAAAVTVPPLDGELKPNNRLEDAPPGTPAIAPDNLVEWQGRLLFSSGSCLCDTEGRTIFDVGATVTAAASSPGGLLALATDADGLSILAPDGTRTRLSGAEASQFNGTTAMAFADERTLFVCVGSTEAPIARWTHDLLQGGRSGALWRIDLDSGDAVPIARGLAFPNGIAFAANGDCIVSESWQKRLIRISASGAGNGQVTSQVIEDLPGYPGRLSRSGRGGYWLCVFAPRSQLIEFVLREPAYRKAMMEEVEPELWIAPALSSGKSVLEPMQGGALRQMGQLKPWAPTQSYGLVVELNEAFVPVRSLHSRAGGRRHGITAAVERAGRLWVTSKGGDELVALDLGSEAP